MRHPTICSFQNERFYQPKDRISSVIEKQSKRKENRVMKIEDSVQEKFESKSVSEIRGR